MTPEGAASSDENKLTWLSNDLTRRLLRVDPTRVEEELTEVTNDYDTKLIYSDYKLKFRIQVIEAGIAGYRERV